ncbi:hypothetical protein SDC9_190764 [bioreactor metagenome]|uniref:Uncharacterized protein n=1 Tax=bioreactor metagenome TaxID=1076179 RepID=A0A645HVX3_9ZZZZ
MGVVGGIAAAVTVGQRTVRCPIAATQTRDHHIAQLGQSARLRAVAIGHGFARLLAAGRAMAEHDQPPGAETPGTIDMACQLGAVRGRIAARWHPDRNARIHALHRWLGSTNHGHGQRSRQQDWRQAGEEMTTRHDWQPLAAYMRNTPKRVSSIGALRAAARPSASTRRVSAGSITPSSQSRAVA